MSQEININLQLIDILMALTLQRKAFCDINSVAPSRYLTGLSTTSLYKLSLLTTLQNKT